MNGKAGSRARKMQRGSALIETSMLVAFLSVVSIAAIESTGTRATDSLYIMSENLKAGGINGADGLGNHTGGSPNTNNGAGNPGGPGPGPDNGGPDDNGAGGL